MNDDRFVKIAKALADPTRRKMVDELRRAAERSGSGLTCTCMCERFPLSQPTISHHVRTLEEAGLITIEKSGQFHVLSINERTLADFAASLLTPSSAAPARSVASDSQAVRTSTTRPRPRPRAKKSA
jgi:ArsR family transcriptional regulator, arsenate/arsenite/antimonite-responsive transcriptional repressor